MMANASMFEFGLKGIGREFVPITGRELRLLWWTILSRNYCQKDDNTSIRGIQTRQDGKSRTAIWAIFQAAHSGSCLWNYSGHQALLAM